jgi:predicted HTH domain antitoxin
MVQFLLYNFYTYLYIMTTMTLTNVPEELEAEHDETARFIAAKLYEAGKITMGKAAAMAGMKKWDFAEILVNYGVHFMDASVQADLDELRKSGK